ncbi:hypothetical protein D9613_007491 [Agrocybe pediades]|uniref:Glucose-methanol-choline oxidoreductase N-terminal domain-containing protein n=1 Tax=Agrocybe pediades TaxID=84607 RepID=A0A8H4QN89_9AGAR|nr:hypothetical protein D9613_007491 [Agrocybe pediades]
MGRASSCIAASRLAEADPDLKFLYTAPLTYYCLPKVLEAGPHSRELDYHVQPGRYLSNLLIPREVFSFHLGKGGKGTGERMHVVPSGRALGGGSSVNSYIRIVMMYMRPAPSDYDDWETNHGNKGWGSKELIPLLKKAETYQPNPHHPSHGYSGPLKISFASGHRNVGEELIEVGTAIDKSQSRAPDLNAFDSTGSTTGRYIDSNTGRRSDTAHDYIYNKDLKNLTIQRHRRKSQVRTNLWKPANTFRNHNKPRLHRNIRDQCKGSQGFHGF